MWGAAGEQGGCQPGVVLIKKSQKPGNQPPVWEGLAKFNQLAVDKNGQSIGRIGCF
jgi:hypothetical protein